MRVPQNDYFPCCTNLEEKRYYGSEKYQFQCDKNRWKSSGTLKINREIVETQYYSMDSATEPVGGGGYLEITRECHPHDSPHTCLTYISSLASWPASGANSLKEIRIYIAIPQS